MSLSRKQYYAMLEEWRVKYKIMPANRLAIFNPTELRVSCFRCGKLKPKMHRHHTGNDLFFARMLPDEFAVQYLCFRKQDVERVCNDCHKAAHRHYHNITIRIWSELNFYGQKIITKEWCIRWMEEYRKCFYTWAAKYKPRKKRCR